jgi:hypothetical protein
MRYLAMAVLMVAMAYGQTWTGSGSNGSDGALNLSPSTPGVAANILDFDPVALNLDVDGDNVYHFTTITISGGLTVRFRANRMRRPGPVVFLATGVVLIQGVLDFSGENGHVATSNDSLRRISIPGPGGYPGGVGAKVGGAPTAGLGPGGGRVAPYNDVNEFRGCPGAHGSAVAPIWCTAAGAPAAYGSNLLQPLVGGSGGSGGARLGNGVGGVGGGAGGGAFRLSSNVAIGFGSALTGTTLSECGEWYIIADGGMGGQDLGSTDGCCDPALWGGAGAGGGVHLQAPVILGCRTHVYARGGRQSASNGGDGRTRIDALSVSGIGAVPPATTNLLTDAPLPPAQPFLRITRINGVNVPVSPRFDYASPDVLINTTSPVPVVLAAANIPVNTPVTVLFTTETGADITATVNLTGTAASSTATVNVTLPLGTARLVARAIW